MSVLFVLVIIGILVASVFLGAFIWAVRSGQFDDTYTPSIRILFDDDISSHTEDEPQKEFKSKTKST